MKYRWKGTNFNFLRQLGQYQGFGTFLVEPCGLQSSVALRKLRQITNWRLWQIENGDKVGMFLRQLRSFHFNSMLPNIGPMCTWGPIIGSRYPTQLRDILSVLHQNEGGIWKSNKFSESWWHSHIYYCPQRYSLQQEVRPLASSRLIIRSICRY